MLLRKLKLNFLLQIVQTSTCLIFLLDLLVPHLALRQTLGVSPDPFLMAVAIAASAAGDIYWVYSAIGANRILVAGWPEAITTMPTAAMEASATHLWASTISPARN